LRQIEAAAVRSDRTPGESVLEVENLPRITRIHNLELKRADTVETRGGRSQPAQSEVPPGWTRAEFLLSIYFESPKKNGEQ
jgi:hypothetical protein